MTEIPSLIQQAQCFNRKAKAFKKAHGFNSASCKEESSRNSYIMTDYVCGYERVLNRKTNRLNKKPVYQSIYSSLDEAFRENSSQRQVFSGLNHYRRDLVVCDIDASEYYFPCLDSVSQLERIVHVHNLCKEYGLPYPSYIEFHKDSGNCQFGWYLSEYFTNYNRIGNELRSNTYKDLVQALAILFRSDRAFKGGNIKNPYHIKNTAYINSTNPVDTKLFIDKVRIAMSERGLIFDKDRGVSKPKSEKSKECVSYRDVGISNSTSRNCYAMAHTRSWIFVYMREHSGKLPSFKETYKVFEAFEYQSLPLVGKLTIESSPEIAASCHSVLEFCKRQYNATLAKSIKECNLSREIQEKRRQSSIVTNQAKRALQYFKAVNLKRQGMTQKEIASELNCTQASISIMLKKNTSEECLSFLTAYVKKHRFSRIQRHMAIMKEIKEILSLLKITLDELLFESSENGSVENIEKSSYFALELTVLEECLSRKHFRRITNARGDPYIRAG